MPRSLKRPNENEELTVEVGASGFKLGVRGRNAILYGGILAVVLVVIVLLLVHLR